MFTKILTLSQIARLKSDDLIAWLDSLPDSGDLDLFPRKDVMPITGIELMSYFDRLFKLRIKKSNTRLVNKKNRVLHALELAHAAIDEDPFVWKDVPRMRKMLQRLKQIGGENDDEYEYITNFFFTHSSNAGEEKGAEKHEEEEEAKTNRKKKTSAKKKEKLETRQIATPFSIAKHKLFKKKKLRKWIQQLADEEYEQKIDKKDISKTFLAHVNWRLHEWIESVVNFLPIASIVNTKKSEMRASCESARLTENEIKQALKLAQHIETKEEIVFKPETETFRDTILFFARPITGMTPDAFNVFQNALKQHTQALLKRYLSQNNGRGPLRVCKKKTLPGQVPKNPAAHVFSANADSFEFDEFDEFDDSQTSDDNAVEQNDDQEEEDEDIDDSF